MSTSTVDYSRLYMFRLTLLLNLLQISDMISQKQYKMLQWKTIESGKHVDCRIDSMEP